MKLSYFLLVSIFTIQSWAQSSYTSTDYAVLGDVLYVTSASELTLDYATTGTDYSWDFSSLNGISQDQLQFRNPIETGYIWPFILNPNNTNISSTKNETTSISAFGQTLGITDINNYYKKSTTQLVQVGSAYKISFNEIQLPVTNEYTDSDVIYNFPLEFGNTDTDESSYTIDIPGLYYQHTTLQRVNEVDGWGSITTPYGTFSNTLRMKTTLIENDTIAIAENGLPRTIRTTRELKWFDTTQKIPVLIVTQNDDSGTWVTSKVEYLDNQQDFQTTALFVYTPAIPIIDEIVYFQNLSTNASTYSWDFDDLSSGSLNTSTDQHPTHIFTSSGTYQVALTASNGTFSDTTTIPVIVRSTLGIGDENFENTLPYPNPFSSKINIGKNLDSPLFYLFNISGEKIYQGEKVYEQDFSYLKPGVYLLLIKNENNISTYKLVKK